MRLSKKAMSSVADSVAKAGRTSNRSRLPVIAKRWMDDGNIAAAFAGNQGDCGRLKLERADERSKGKLRGTGSEAELTLRRKDGP